MFKTPVTVQSATEFLQNHFTVHTENQTSGSSLLNEFEVLQSTKKIHATCFQVFLFKKRKKRRYDEQYAKYVSFTCCRNFCLYVLGIRNGITESRRSTESYRQSVLVSKITVCNRLPKNME